MLKKLGTVIALLGLAVFLPLASQAANLGSLTITPTSMKPGGTVTVSGSFGANNTASNVRFSLDSGTATVDLSPQNNATVTTDQGGYFSAKLTVPSDFATSNATLTATAANGDTLTGKLSVSSTATGSNATTTTTPSGGVRAGNGGLTGIGGEIALAAVFMGAGAAILLASRRKISDRI